MSKERIEAYEQAMNVVCGECGNTDGAQCDECWVKRSWRVMNGMPDSPTNRPYIAHITIPLSVYFKATSEEEATYMAENIAADTDRLHGLLDKVFADSGSNAHVARLEDDSDDEGYADIALDASEVRQNLDEQDDYK